MQFFQIAAVLLMTATWGEARAERFSINDAISQAALTNPGVDEASANRRATEAELRQTQGGEVNVIDPVAVVGNEGPPAPRCEPAARPASNTAVSAGLPTDGMWKFPGAKSPRLIVSVACASVPSTSRIV